MNIFKKIKINFELIEKMFTFINNERVLILPLCTF